VHWRRFGGLFTGHLSGMVNGWFPDVMIYGFEMVDAVRTTRPRPASRHQSKIYAESNQSDFSQFFAELISMQTLAIYRALLVRGSIARDQAQRLRGIATGSKRVG
jgi:hypothetical protein